MSDDVSPPGTGYTDGDPLLFDRVADTFGGVPYWFGAGTSAIASAVVVGAGLITTTDLFGVGLATLGAVATYGVLADE